MTITQRPPERPPKVVFLDTPTEVAARAEQAKDNNELEQLRIENARLKRENQRYVREMEHLRTGAKVSLEEMDTQQLANAMAHQAALTLNAERAFIGLTENEDTTIRAGHWNGQSIAPQDLPAHTPHGIGAWVVIRRQPYICNDPRNDPLMSQQPSPRWQSRNALCVPILSHNKQVLGIIELHNRRDGAMFSNDDVRTAQVLAMQAAIGFERARLFERMQEWAQSLETLLAFNAAINEHLDPSTLVRRLVENAARFLKSDGGMAGLAVPDKEGNIIMVADAYWHQGKWYDYPRIWLRDEGLPGFMLVSEFPYVANNYVDDRLADHEIIARFDVRQALCVPIKDGHDHVLGFFKLHKNTIAQPFTWQDAAFLESLANTTAVAIRNAQLLKTLEIKSAQVQALSAEHLNRLEEERRRISRELHDEAGQALISIKLALQVLSLKVRGHLPELSAELDDLRDQVNISTAQLKDMARRLRPPTLDELGLTVAVRQLASEYAHRTGIQMQLALTEYEQRLPQTVETALYRITQEALTNVAKHANATTVWLALASDPHTDDIRLTISDDGCGFDASTTASTHAGLGLMGMKERAALLGGKVLINSGEEGTHIAVLIPVAK